MYGTQCYKRLRQYLNGVTFREARTLCSNEFADVMMPQLQSQAQYIVNLLDCGNLCWIGVTDFDADHIYTWEDGTDESQSNLYFGAGEPNRRDRDYMCAYILDSLLYDGACTATERVICEKGGHFNETKTPTTVASTLDNKNCKSKANTCQCKRRMSNSTESLKITDYIWLRKCKVQPLIDSGVLNEINCPFTCSCSPKDNSDKNSAMYDMFACVRRP
ncbi:unnamed protein product [Mytilus edulis]|uniref:C-type lectin domain-containing protein n=1 Tax=Mytilus edulis TaxID=6550 RepID=A0A8S3V492_MYTED|nr:unnamed protein product [Mytilus edulis]